MKTICVLALGALVVGCHLDKLIGGSGGPHPTSTAPPVALVFMAQPKSAQVGQQITPVQVSVVDSVGVPVAGADTATVSVRLGANPGGAKLLGDTAAKPTRGVATFGNISLDKPGQGYTLIAHVSVSGPPDTTSASFNIDPPPPTTGDLTVTTNTTGQNLDPDGYTVTVDGSNSQSIATNSSSGVTFPGLPAGNHPVALSGVASNCTVSGANPRTVSVAAGTGGSTVFAVTCTAPPAGSLTVSTTTNGPNAPSGYTATVDGGTSQSVGATGSVTFNNLSVGTHSVGLSPIPSNCSVSQANPQTVSITANNTTPASFTISCSATTGDLVVTTATTGDGLPTNGYTVTVEGSSKPIAITGNATFSGLNAGDHAVMLSGVPSNCTVSPGTSQNATVIAGTAVTAPFAITCMAPQNHAPVVNAGPDQPVLLSVLTMTLEGASFSDVDHDGPWQVTIDWGDGQSTSFTAPNEGAINGQHTYSDLLPTTHTLTITVQDAHGAIGRASKNVKIQL